MPLHKRQLSKVDGRQIILYGTQPYLLPVQPSLISPGLSANSHLRWHPFRQEWVCYAAHRQDRTFKPPTAYCPLCPTQNDSSPTEIPFPDFEVAVFDNRFPAFHLNSPQPPELSIPTAPAIGHCEVMVYSANHHESLGTLPLAQRELIVQVWSDRYQELLTQDPIQFVMPFENRGEAVGVTLHHPHGQIYAFSYIPPVVANIQHAFREQPGLQTLRKTMGSDYDIFADAEIVAFVPPFQRYPYEVWLTTHQFHPGPWTFSELEIRSLATALGKIVRLYDRLFNQPLPYMMLLYAAPKGEERTFQFHLQFLPLLRSADKLKYLAGCETGAGTFLADILPEESAKILRQYVDDQL
jgi:UDPglucose--hexose-1-phosphate uridylyltransferase